MEVEIVELLLLVVEVMACLYHQLKQAVLLRGQGYFIKMMR
jgi:hypothetical protein